MTTPTIDDVTWTGELATGKTLTVAGTNLQDEDTANYDAAWNASDFGFEGASLSADGWFGGEDLVYDSSVSLLGSKSVYWTSRGDDNDESQAGRTEAGTTYRSAGNELSTTAGNFFLRVYMREDPTLGNDTWCDQVHKYFANPNGAVQPYFLHDVGDPDPSTAYRGIYLFLQGEGSNFDHYYRFSSGTQSKYQGSSVWEPKKWYCFEAEIPGASPWQFNVWINGEQISPTTGNGRASQDPTTAPNDFEFPWNSITSDVGTVHRHWYEGWAYSVIDGNRCYPACVVQIDDTSDFSNAPKYQWPISITNTSVQVECDLTGLTGPNYWMRVTNGRNEASSIRALTGTAQLGTARAVYFR
jgi:hypothetical protein